MLHLLTRTFRSICLLVTGIFQKCLEGHFSWDTQYKAHSDRYIDFKLLTRSAEISNHPVCLNRKYITKFLCILRFLFVFLFTWMV